MRLRPTESDSICVQVAIIQGLTPLGAKRFPLELSENFGKISGKPLIVGKYAASHNFILLGKHKKTSSGKGQLTHSHNFDDMDELIASIKRLKFSGM